MFVPSERWKFGMDGISRGWNYDRCLCIYSYDVKGCGCSLHVITAAKPTLSMRRYDDSCAGATLTRPPGPAVPVAAAATAA